MVIIKILMGTTKIAVGQKPARGRTYSAHDSHALVRVPNWIC